MIELRAQIARIARTPRLLVACDYDGVLAPITDHPDLALPSRPLVSALERLADLAQTDAAIVSGRSLASLRAVLGPVRGLALLGGHGAEREQDARAAGHEVAEAVERIESAMRAIAQADPGMLVERKAFGVALHYRNAEPAAGLRAAELAGSVAKSVSGARVLSGKMVVEIIVGGSHKGEAVSALRRENGATGVVFIGDDVTDEDAFCALGSDDVGVHVGHGPTAAGHLIQSDEALGEILSLLHDARVAWLAEVAAPPVQQHHLLSDQRTVALADTRASIVWMCSPRIDSPALFASLLGGPAAGSFDVRPEHAELPLEQRYSGDDLILESRWVNLVVRDYLDCSGGRAFQRAGRTDLVRVLEGHGRTFVRFAPRPDFGRAAYRLAVREGGVAVEGLPDPIYLHAPDVAWRIEREGAHESALGEVRLVGTPVVLELRCGAAGRKEALPPEPARRAATQRFWSQWAGTLELPAIRPDLVKRSALTIKALVHGPTGAIAAAATTSLPEWPGGVRNWDYRYCWPRDASLSASALVRLGNAGHAMKLLDWMLGLVETIGSAQRMRPIYSVTWSHLGPEAEIANLRGYVGSRPVRIGNAASEQVQLDIFGPIVELAHLLVRRGTPLSGEHLRLIDGIVEAVVARWREPDHGIWEIRGQQRHHVHSKAMCFQAADCAIAIMDSLGEAVPPEWIDTRDAIRRDVLEHGYSPRLRSFSAAYGFDELDASALAVGLSGLVEPADPRWVTTVEAIERHLFVPPVVRRYTYDDGLPGREGGWHICTAWLIEALITLGRLDRARELFDGLASIAGPTGLLSEEWDPVRGQGLGNFPQAYSHLAVINAAVKLHEAGLRS